MTKYAQIKKEFIELQWFGHDYPYYDDDAEENLNKIGDVVEVLREATPNPMGKLYVIYNERINQSAVVHEDYIEKLWE